MLSITFVMRKKRKLLIQSLLILKYNVRKIIAEVI